MAERLNAAVLKTVDGGNVIRGFESLPLRLQRVCPVKRGDRAGAAVEGSNRSIEAGNCRNRHLTGAPTGARANTGDSAYARASGTNGRDVGTTRRASWNGRDYRGMRLDTAARCATSGATGGARHVHVSHRTSRASGCHGVPTWCKAQSRESAWNRPSDCRPDSGLQGRTGCAERPHVHEPRLRGPWLWMRRAVRGIDRCGRPRCFEPDHDADAKSVPSGDRHSGRDKKLRFGDRCELHGGTVDHRDQRQLLNGTQHHKELDEESTATRQRVQRKQQWLHGDVPSQLCSVLVPSGRAGLEPA